MRHAAVVVAATSASLSGAALPAIAQDPLYKLLANDGAADDNFGNSVGISATRAIVGAPGDDDQGDNAGAAYLFDVITGIQYAKLLADDGAQLDEFGLSVAISGTRAIVGAHGDDPNGGQSGSAYLFDATTGGQITKLTPDDGAAGDQFGHSVAMSGTKAVVGADRHDALGAASGAAYLFDATTGAQIAKLLPEDGETGDRFGFSVGISGAVAIVGSHQEDDNGDRAGAAYLFDATTGAQLAKLLADDGAATDEFGKAVAISGTRAIVGTKNDDDNGSTSGSAYLFDVTTGTQITKLLPDDGAAGDAFGSAVAISGTMALVAAPFDDDNGTASGAVYVFDAASGAQVAKILPVDNAANDWFASSVAIDGVNSFFGVPVDDDLGNDSGAAYLTVTDTDKDGLLDSWETLGIDVNGDSVTDLDLPALGADPDHKDLFVEVDVMISLTFQAAAQTNLVQAFAGAPNALVDNPDGLDGITLHLLVDETNVSLIPFPNTWNEFDAVKAVHFGTPAQRADPNWPNIEAAKKLAYRYCIFGQSHSGGKSSGFAEIGGNDFTVTLGTWTTPGGTVDQQTGTFMHEFGHALNLRHGGDDDINHKPNYYSVMNYTWQVPHGPHSVGWRLDYSHAALPTLNESALNEPNGLGAPMGAFLGVLTPFSVDSPTTISYAALQGGVPVDWDGDGDETATATAVDINYLSSKYQNASPGQVLTGHADWSSLKFELFGEDFADGVHNTTSENTEMTLEIFNELSALPPLPEFCDTDGNLDGMVDIEDFLAVLAQWGTDCPCSADTDGDGDVDIEDFLAVLLAWGPCP